MDEKGAAEAELGHGLDSGEKQTARADQRLAYPSRSALSNQPDEDVGLHLRPGLQKSERCAGALRITRPALAAACRADDFREAGA
jgi:hypothetical protein